MKKIFIIGVSWEQLPLVKKAKEMGLYVIVTTWWDKEKIEADMIYENVDSRDIEKLEEIFLKEKPDAVIADECDYSMYAVAYLTEKYRLPGPSLEALTITNNKYLQREIAKKNNILQPDFKLCWNINQAINAAKEINYPVILKPLDNRGSIGVIKVDNEKELIENFYITIANSHSRMLLVEKFIIGEMIHIDSFYDSNKINNICLVDIEKYSNSNVGKELHFPTDKYEYLKYDLFDINNKIIEIFGINYGFTHFEFLIEEKTGKIHFIEGANRGAGVCISNIILPLFTENDLLKNFINMSLGEKIDIKISKINKKALLYFFNYNKNGTIETNELINKQTPFIFQKSIKDLKDINKLGALGRIGAVILIGDDFKKLEKNAEYIETNIKNVDKEKVLFFKEEINEL